MLVVVLARAGPEDVLILYHKVYLDSWKKFKDRVYKPDGLVCLVQEQTMGILCFCVCRSS